MSSWLARSLANSLRLDAYENDVASDPPATSPTTHHPQPQQDNAVVGSEEEQELEQGRGVKEDLDEIKQTLTRQFWGMASFLAPPPLDSDSHPPPPLSPQNQQPPFLDGPPIDHHQSLGDDSHPEQGTLRVDDPYPIRSHSDAIDEQEPEMEDYDLVPAVGITEEVLAFAMNIAMHPETWLDFPIDEEDDPQDFDMSEAQQEHAMVIEGLTPRLAALRIELCPCHMSESYFWKVYFVLLHSRLNKQDATVLSTPQVMAARAMWMQELHKQMKPEFEFSGRSTVYSRGTAQQEDFTRSLLGDANSDVMTPRTYGYETASSSMPTDNWTEKHVVESSETIYNSAIEENPIIKTENRDLKCGRSSQIIVQNYDDDEDIDWPEEDSDLGGYVRTNVNEEDISFSDLEDDDYGIKPVSCNTGSKVV